MCEAKRIRIARQLNALKMLYDAVEMNCVVLSAEIKALKSANRPSSRTAR
jgi:tRNA threonylcarbamoyladenosine modification (KEOPS) complex Cgi121 subunit